MTLITFTDITGRFFFGKPVLGCIELTELIMAVIGGIAVFHTATQEGHINVDVVFNRFPKRVQTIITGFGMLLGAATWGIIAYQIVGDSQSKIALGRITDVLKIPVGPFELVLAFGLALFSLTLIIQFFRPFRRQKDGK
jgi:TRAP-type C4-dicarboxylate transport system permease small subunit